MKKFYITTAIAYANAKPHIWHALEIIQADVLARSYRMVGKSVVFQTGTDEHGIKNWRTAEREGKEIHEFLDENVNAFKDMYKKLSISYDTFLRTSDKDQHYPWAQKLWNALVEADDIYKKSYAWLYCVWCESFKTEKELENGKCPDHPNLEIEKVQEENYFFKLSKYKDQVIQIIKDNTYHIYPEARKNEILSFLEKANDISFSRPKSNLPRWIPVPGDENHVMYVRCDALSNYITGQWYENDENKFKETRPAEIHLIWKDILRFHAAFWPAMLLSAKIALPKKLLVHGHVTLNGQKMSKSTGNVIDPMDILREYPRDAFVFNLMYDISIATDWDFSPERLKNIYESMLIWWRGNLVNRVTSLSQKYEIKKAMNITELRQLFKWEDTNPLLNLFEKGFDNNIIEKQYLDSANIKTYLEDWYKLVQKTNEFITKAEPRKKYKDEMTKNEAIKDLQFLLYIVKNLAILSSTFLTDGFKKIQEIFGNESLNKIDTSKNMDSINFKEIFDDDNFAVELSPKIIYEKKE